MNCTYPITSKGIFVFFIFHSQEIAGIFRNLRKVELRLRSEYTVQIFPPSLQCASRFDRERKRTYYLIVVKLQIVLIARLTKRSRVPAVNSCAVSTIGRHAFPVTQTPFFDTQIKSLVPKDSGAANETRKFAINQVDKCKFPT